MHRMRLGTEESGELQNLALMALRGSTEVQEDIRQQPELDMLLYIEVHIS